MPGNRPGHCGIYRGPAAPWKWPNGGSHRPEGVVVIPGFSEVSSDKTAYARAFALHYREQDPVRGRTLAQPHPKTVIVQNPPAPPLSAAELDHIYELPFSRRTHPSYPEPVPALEPVQFSVVSHRGCFGSCSFCALTHHQGRIIQSRSIGSIVREVTRMAVMPEFKGIVKDVGGPTANMYGTECDRWGTAGACPDMSCSPACPTLRTSHRKLADLLKRISDVPGVKKVFVSSGIRYDLVLADDSGSRYLDDLCDCHVSGHLKVAPEHISPHVTEAMNKPDGSVFDRFVNRFEALQKGKPKRQYLVPYFMSGHPGCTVSDMVELAEYIRDRGLYTEQVQDFTPTPMSVSTSMYLHRPKPVHARTGTCAQREGEEDPAGAHAVPGTTEPGPRARRAPHGRAGKISSGAGRSASWPGRAVITGSPGQAAQRK